MVSNAVVVPVAVLAAIAVCMFAFVCWWFPRAWTQGQTADMREYAERTRQRDLELAASDIRAGEETDVPNSEVPKMSNQAQVRSTYVPPVTPY